MGSLAWTFMLKEIQTILGDDYEAFVKERERHNIFTVIPSTNPAHRLPSNSSANGNDNVKITVDGSPCSSSSRLSSPGSHNSTTQNVSSKD